MSRRVELLIVCSYPQEHTSCLHSVLSLSRGVQWNSRQSKGQPWTSQLALHPVSEKNFGCFQLFQAVYSVKMTTKHATPTLPNSSCVMGVLPLSSDSHSLCYRTWCTARLACLLVPLHDHHHSGRPHRTSSSSCQQNSSVLCCTTAKQVWR